MYVIFMVSFQEYLFSVHYLENITDLFAFSASQIDTSNCWFVTINYSVSFTVNC